jgi:transposase-like protein
MKPTKRQIQIAEHFVKRVLNEAGTRENYIGVNESPKLKKALDQVETILKGYTKGQTKSDAMAALNVLYSLIQ